MQNNNKKVVSVLKLLAQHYFI